MVYTNSRTNGSRKGRANYSREFKQRLVEAANQPGVSVSKLAQEHGIGHSTVQIEMGDGDECRMHGHPHE